MSIEELKSDHAAIEDKIRSMVPALTTAPELASFLQNELMPLLGNFVSELAEMDDTVQDIYTGADDILQPETGGLFAAAISGAMGILTVLEKRLVATNLEDAKILKALKEWKPIATEALETIQEITIPDTDDDEGDEDDGDEDGDDAEDSDEEEAK